MSEPKKEKFRITSNVASFKTGDVVELDPNKVPTGLQAHVVMASKDSKLTVNPAMEGFQKKVEALELEKSALEQEVEDLLREKYEALHGEKAGGNTKLSTLRAKIKDKEAE